MSRWPEGKRVAVSLSFDDGRLSQIDQGMAILDGAGIRATFYVLPSSVEQRLEGWRAAVARGHEIGNHTLSHPCSGNFMFSREKNALEDYTLARLAADIDAAQDALSRLLEVVPQTFAYPCGQTFVGRGRNVASYVPLVAERFLAGRVYPSEGCNAPEMCDLAQVYGYPMDNARLDDLLAVIEKTRSEEGWLVLVGHETRDEGAQTISLDVLHGLCAHLADPANDIYCATVAAIAGEIAAGRDGHG